MVLLNDWIYSLRTNIFLFLANTRSGVDKIKNLIYQVLFVKHFPFKDVIV